MSIDWGALGVVAVVSFAVAVGVTALVAFALVGLSARVPAAATADGRRPGLSPAAGTAVAAVCLAGTLAIVGYGMWIIIS